MKYRVLGKTGLKVSVIGIGAWQYGGEWGKEFTVTEVKSILARGQELGFNFIDTAECYGDHLSEKLIGEAIAGQRDKWVISTKFGHKFLPNFGREGLWRTDDVLKQLDDSLRALRTDSIDLYHFHSGGNEVLEDESLWTMLQQQQKAGKIKHLGISLHPVTTDNVYQTQKAAELGVSCIELLYNRLDRYPENSLFGLCQKYKFGVIARVPLASGYLSGKYKPGATFAGSDIRSIHNRQTMDTRLAQVQEIITQEVPAGQDVAQWALAWCLKHDAVSTCIPGFKNIAQLESGAAAAELVSGSHPLAWK
jgi:aryl-alcohol dehydrogenase-like predicted oxidoreductase